MVGIFPGNWFRILIFQIVVHRRRQQWRTHDGQSESTTLGQWIQLGEGELRGRRELGGLSASDALYFGYGTRQAWRGYGRGLGRDHWVTGEYHIVVAHAKRVVTTVVCIT